MVSETIRYCLMFIARFRRWITTPDTIDFIVQCFVFIAGEKHILKQENEGFVQLESQNISVAYIGKVDTIIPGRKLSKLNFRSVCDRACKKLELIAKNSVHLLKCEN